MRCPFAFLTAALLASSLTAQVEYGGSPQPLEPGRRQPASVLLPEVDTAALLAEDARRVGGPLRYGHVQAGTWNPGNSGSWELLPGGGRLWRLRVQSPDAQSIGLLFSSFDLPIGAEVFVYDDERTVVHGAYIHLSQNPDGTFAVQPVPGDAVTIEYYEPPGVHSPANVQLSGVVHDYRGIVHSAGRGSCGGACNNDVICPEGAPWQDQIDSVVKILNSGLACSGFLVNNTDRDGRQLVISANHCNNLNNAIFQFNFQNSTCGTDDAFPLQSVVGSVKLANDRTHDFRLVELSTPIPPAYNPYFAGWNRDSLAASSAIGVHHPQGCPKKISFENDPLVKPAGSITWQVVDWDDGTTEPGSSGSPLFGPDGRAIGQLSTGTAACNNDDSDFYGALDEYWSMVSPFLDPIGTGELAIEGYDPDAVPPAQITAVVPDTVDILIPGPDETITIQGANFSASSVVALDGATIITTWTILDKNTIQFDMPETTLGAHTLSVVNPNGSGDFPITVVAPTEPKLQVLTGEECFGTQSFLGFPFTLSGQPGDVIVLVSSFSGLPSVLPGILDLDLGNDFQNVYHCGSWVIEDDGLTDDEIRINGLGLGGLDVYLQAVRLDFPFPLTSSNSQKGHVF